MIKLQTASATQTDGNEGKSPWIVNSETGEELYELPVILDEKDAMKIIHFGRKFELEAFNIGTAHGNELATKKSAYRIEVLETTLRDLAARNELLSTELLKQMEKDES